MNLFLPAGKASRAPLGKKGKEVVKEGKMAKDPSSLLHTQEMQSRTREPSTSQLHTAGMAFQRFGKAKLSILLVTFFLTFV